MLAGTLSSTGALSNAGSVVASGGSLNAGSVDNASGGGFTIDGATVTAGPFTNAGTATLQSGSLSVGVLTNSGTLAANGGSLDATSVTNESGGGFTIDGATVTAGPFTNAGTATLQSGSLSVSTLTNSGTLGATMGRVTRARPASPIRARRLHDQRCCGDRRPVHERGHGHAAIIGLAERGCADQQRHPGGERRRQLGATSMTNAEPAAASTINGATVTTEPVHERGTATATLQSGSLSVGTVANSGTLNLNGGTFTRGAATTFGNSGTVNLNFGTLSLAGGEGSLSGGNYAVGSGATLRFSGGSYHVGSLGGAGSSEIDGGNVTAAAVSVASGGQLRVLSRCAEQHGCAEQRWDGGGKRRIAQRRQRQQPEQRWPHDQRCNGDRRPVHERGHGDAAIRLAERGCADQHRHPGGERRVTRRDQHHQSERRPGSRSTVRRVTTGPFTNAGTATLQSGSLSVGTVIRRTAARC